MTDYEELTQKYKNLYAELTSLNVMRELIDKRRDKLQQDMEKNLSAQEMYWPSFKNEPNAEQSELLSDFIANPDLTLKDLAKKHNLLECVVSRKLTLEMNLNRYKKEWAGIY